MPENLLHKYAPWVLGLIASIGAAAISWRISTARTEEAYNARLDNLTSAVERAFRAISGIKSDVKVLSDLENMESRSVSKTLAEICTTLKGISANMEYFRQNQDKHADRILALERQMRE